jgi:xylosylprotein 4-beta-galactosyltransferase
MHKLGICIPYRDREAHLREFVPQLHRYLNQRGIAHHFFIAQQDDQQPLNRGFLKNVAATFAR